MLSFRKEVDNKVMERQNKRQCAHYLLEHARIMLAEHSSYKLLFLLLMWNYKQALQSAND